MKDLPRDVERKLAKLEALEAGGVDNWEWYDESLTEWFEENKVEEAKDSFIESLHDLLCEAEVDEPAGRGCGYSIEFDEDLVRKLLEGFLKDVKEG